MSRKKGVAVAIIAVFAVIGGMVALANMPRQEGSSLAPLLTTMDRSNESENDSTATTIAEKPEEQQQQPDGTTNGSVSAGNTVIANNTTIVINKPVYRNNTIIYQPVTINLENYKTVINTSSHPVQASGEVGGNSQPDGQAADTNHSMTITAKRIKSEGWSDRFIDDRTGMFTAVYDIHGNLIDAGYADERGFTVGGLEDKLYFVFPADCTDCNGSKNDIMFQHWEDGSTDRPRLVPADSELTASYRLVVPERPKQVPITPPPGENPPGGAEQEAAPRTDNGTASATEPKITLEAQDARFVYGWVQVIARLQNKVDGFDQITITVYRPDGTLHDTFSYSDQMGFFASREAGEGDYRIVATYEYGNGTAEAEITHPIKFATPEFSKLAVMEDDGNGTVRLNGMLENGIAGENITISVKSPSGGELKKYRLSFGTTPVFTLFISADDVDKIFKSTGNYTFTVTHVPTGVTGNATLFHGAPETQTANVVLNVSANTGRSVNAAIAAQGSRVYAVWEDDTSGQSGIMFAKSDDGGKTFGEPVTIGQPEAGGFVQDPDIAVSGNNVYVVWADYDSGEASTAAFAMSADAGNTFGNKTVLGDRLGEGADPNVAVFGGNVYVSWIRGAQEEFAGNLIIARSSDGIVFEAAQMTEKVDAVSMTSTDTSLYLTWLHYPTGDSSEQSINFVARSENGVDFEITEEDPFPGIVATSIAASPNNNNTVYVAGYANDTVILAKGNSGDINAFSTTEISNGTTASVAASGNAVYLAWEWDGEIFFSSSSDRGETFGDPENISNSDEISYWPNVAAANQTAYIAWTEGAGSSSDILVVAAS
ncbi:MAG: hypothetical protein HRF40_09935 [Nitrososphaera sp.]